MHPRGPARSCVPAVSALGRALQDPRPFAGDGKEPVMRRAYERWDSFFSSRCGARFNGTARAPHTAVDPAGASGRAVGVSYTELQAGCGVRYQIFQQFLVCSLLRACDRFSRLGSLFRWCHAARVISTAPQEAAECAPEPPRSSHRIAQRAGGSARKADSIKRWKNWVFYCQAFL